MGRKFQVTIDRFDGGMVSDPRDKREATAQVVTNFDILRDPYRMIPYHESKDGDSSSSDNKIRNFLTALRTGSTYAIFGLGVASGTTKPKIFYRDLNDLTDATWTASSDPSSDTGVNYNLFVYYPETGLIYGARGGSAIWKYEPSSDTFTETEQGLSYNAMGQGIVHPSDKILYIPYSDGSDVPTIAKNDNGSWTNDALSLPKGFIITSLTPFGSFLAIGMKPRGEVGKSFTYLWDRDSSLSTVSGIIDWGEGALEVQENVNGELIGIMISGSAGDRFFDRISIKRWTGSRVVEIEEFTNDTSGQSFLEPYQQLIDNRLYFVAAMEINGNLREGIFSVGRSRVTGDFVIVHERTPNNDTEVQSSLATNLFGFMYIGDYLFQTYLDENDDDKMSKTNSATSNQYGHTSIYESKLFSGRSPAQNKKLVSVGVMTEAMPTDGQVVLKYKKDEESSYTTIFTNTTDNDVYHEAVNIESSGATLPRFREISFRIESSGGAAITGLRFVFEEIDSNPSS